MYFAPKFPSFALMKRKKKPGPAPPSEHTSNNGEKHDHTSISLGGYKDEQIEAIEQTARTLQLVCVLWTALTHHTQSQ